MCPTVSTTTDDPTTGRPLGTRDLLTGFVELGIEPGATLFVHSSLSSFGPVEGAEHAVIDALLQAVGRSGLVAMPTHTWSTVHARQPVFHQSLSPSTVGRITESFRHRPGVLRSLHPTHSVAALGPDAHELVRGHERYSTPCSPSSPYGQLIERAGQVLLIGVGLESFTLMHGFEEWAATPWLFNRTESLWTITDDNLTLPVPSRRHTNDPRFKTRDFPSLEPVLQEHEAIRYTTTGTATLRLIDAGAAAACLVPLIGNDPDIVLAHPQRPATVCPSVVPDPEREPYQ
jgi:aminoglycoside 3-N-acetyltransferase